MTLEMRGLKIFVKWSLIFHCVSCQFVGSEYSRNRDPYNILTNHTTSTSSSGGIEKTVYQDHQNRDYDWKFDEREQYVNSTHSIRGNVTEYYDPNIYGGSVKNAELIAKGVSDNRRIQNYRTDGFYNDAYDVTATDPRPGERRPGYEEINTKRDVNVPGDPRFRDATRRYDDSSSSVTQRNYQNSQQQPPPFGFDNGAAYPSGGGAGSSQYQRDKANYQNPYNSNPTDPSNPYGRPNDPENPYGKQNDPVNPYARPNDPANPYGRQNDPGNPSYGRPDDPANPYGRSNNQSPVNTYGRNVNPSNPYNLPGVPYSGSSGTQFGTNTGFSERPQPFPIYPNQYNPGQSNPYGNQPGNRDTFDPGNPYKNIWNEHWSTTTDHPTAPGVLGKWRPDLQGRQRPEDIQQVPTAVYVTTAYGRVQV